MPTGKTRHWMALAAVLITPSAAAFDCHPYEEVTAKLSSSYSEQLLFSAFADADDKTGSNSVYELWVNPERGNWSLLAHRVFLFQRDTSTGVQAKSCSLIVSSGKKHRLLSAQPVAASPDQIGPPQAQPAGVELNDDEGSGVATINSTLNCIPRERHAAALKQRYNEVPLMRALAEDDTVLEFYGSGDSWTITQSKIREVRNTMTGRPLIDQITGQKIHQLCSDPAYSGKTWTLFDPSQSHI